MSTEKYIISNCVISNKIVLKNGEQLYVADNENIHQFLLSVYHLLKVDYPKFYKMDNLSKLGWLASEVLLKDENISAFKPAETGLVLANANASLDADIKYFNAVKEVASPALFVYTLPNIVAGEISIRNGFKGENAFFVFEEFNAVFIEQYVNDLFDNNVLKLCICGWIDVLDENYKAVLFLVATKTKQDVLLFSKENINKIFKSA